MYIFSLMIVFCFMATTLSSISMHAIWEATEIPSETILYMAYSDYMYSLYAIDQDGSNQRFVIESNSGWFRPSSDGEKIVLLQHRSGSLMEGEYDIYVMNSDGTELTQLTRSMHNFSPVWSPSGNKIAYVSGQNDNYDVYLRDLTDLNLDPVRLTDLKGLITELAWSPGGQSLAFTICDENLLCDIYLIASDGTGLENITSDFDENVSYISWSPDGEQIAFVAYPVDEYQRSDIYTFDLQRGAFGKLSNESAEYQFLEWEPDGSKLAYVSDLAETWDVYLLDLNSLEHSNLTANSELQDGFYGLGWSPNGKRIVFSAGPVEGDFEIFVMNADGSNVYQLTDNEVHDVRPVWITYSVNNNHSDH